jgi:hypothetical protein
MARNSSILYLNLLALSWGLPLFFLHQDKVCLALAWSAVLGVQCYARAANPIALLTGVLGALYGTALVLRGQAYALPLLMGYLLIIPYLAQTTSTLSPRLKVFTYLYSLISLVVLGTLLQTSELHPESTHLPTKIAAESKTPQPANSSAQPSLQPIYLKPVNISAKPAAQSKPAPVSGQSVQTSPSRTEIKIPMLGWVSSINEESLLVISLSCPHCLDLVNAALNSAEAHSYPPVIYQTNQTTFHKTQTFLAAYFSNPTEETFLSLFNASYDLIFTMTDAQFRSYILSLYPGGEQELQESGSVLRAQKDYLSSLGNPGTPVLITPDAQTYPSKLSDIQTPYGLGVTEN